MNIVNLVLATNRISARLGLIKCIQDEVIETSEYLNNQLFVLALNEG